uniref:Uncharacterized protein n=1 Tax=Amphimedon queenslandica TaxID=400682 RepID=A0A1X7TYH7_AMPQE
MWSVITTLYEQYTGQILFPANEILKLNMELRAKLISKLLGQAVYVVNLNYHLKD